MLNYRKTFLILLAIYVFNTTFNKESMLIESMNLSVSTFISICMLMISFFAFDEYLIARNIIVKKERAFLEALKEYPDLNFMNLRIKYLRKLYSRNELNNLSEDDIKKEFSELSFIIKRLEKKGYITKK